MTTVVLMESFTHLEQTGLKIVSNILAPINVIKMIRMSAILSKVKCKIARALTLTVSIVMCKA